jgi:hypothetical protein
MRARLLLQERHVLSEDRFVEIVVWELPQPTSGSPHPYKYRLAFVVSGKCVLRFDNETGKGDHQHVGNREMPYRFSSANRLLTDFWDAIEAWRPR